MDHGGVVAIGPAQEISELYAASGRRNEERCRSWTYREAPGDERFKIARIAVVSDANEAIAPIATNTAFNVEADYWNLVDDAKIILELIVRASDGTPVFHSYSSESDEKAGRPHRIGLYRSSCRVPGNLLNSGRYDIEMYFSHGRADQEFGLVNTISIVVHDLEERGNLTYYGRFIGHVHPMLSWRSRMIETAPNKSPELT
jgi:hypothetical protein